MNHKIDSTNFGGFNNVIGSANNALHKFGLNTQGLLKPFTTNSGILNYPAYQNETCSISNSGGYFGATSIGLNPFGLNTVGEGLLWGTGYQVDYDFNHEIPEQTNIRSLGIKTPFTFVGWGYDIFGYPTPNVSVDWMTSGVFGSENPDLTGFLTFIHSGSTIANSGTVSGTEIPYYNFLSGPLDLRWDPHRKVWTGYNGGVYNGVILETLVSGSTDNFSLGTEYFAEVVTYTARINDGAANQFMVTGVAPIGPRPEASTYKIRPLISGDFCFIVQHPDDVGSPKFNIWAVEPPGVEACSNIAGDSGSESIASTLIDDTLVYDFEEQGDFQEDTSSGVLSVLELNASLLNYPLTLSRGGLGISGLIPEYSIFGDSSGDLVQKGYIAGTGIEIYQYGTGIEIRIASGVEFNLASGINTSITEIAGLTTPLSIDQGGTGSDTQIFVDTYSSQAVSGYKRFTNYIAIASYDVSGSFPPLHFYNRSDAGIGYASMSTPSGVDCSGITIFSSGDGNDCAFFSERRIVFRQPVLIDIDDNVASGQFQPLIVRANFNGPSDADMITFEDMTTNRVAGLNVSGLWESKFLFANGYRDTTSPLTLRQGETPTYPPLIIISSGSVERFKIDPNCDILRMNMEQASGTAYINMGGYNPGYIDLSASSGYIGGYIDLSDGGYLRTTAGGGNIDTTSGFIELGVSGYRTTLSRTNFVGENSLSLPSNDGVLATEGYADNLLSAGWNGEVIADGQTMIFVSGILISASGSGVTPA